MERTVFTVSPDSLKKQDVFVVTELAFSKAYETSHMVFVHFGTEKQDIRNKNNRQICIVLSFKLNNFAILAATFKTKTRNHRSMRKARMS